MAAILNNIHVQRVQSVRADDEGSYIEINARVGLNSGNKREEVPLWLTRSQALTLAMGLLTALAKRS